MYKRQVVDATAKEQHVLANLRDGWRAIAKTRGLVPVSYTHLDVYKRQWIARAGHALVYGGSSVGLMGAVSRAAIEGGAPVIGLSLIHI